jgi:hypothetical protein
MTGSGMTRSGAPRRKGLQPGTKHTTVSTQC